MAAILRRKGLSVNAHALAVLDYGQVLEKVALRANSERGRAAVLALRPGTDLAAIRTELARVAEMLRYLEDHSHRGLPSIPDVETGLRVLSVEGGVLDPDQVLALSRLLEAIRTLRSALNGEGENELDPQVFVHLLRLRARLTEHPRIQERLHEVVDAEGRIRDGASGSLSSLRGRLRSARTGMVQKLERYLTSLPERYRVPDASVSVRDGRYVVPIRREGKGEVGGVIHGESSTGATLFVEPPMAIRLMNEVQELEREEAREIHRILTELTGVLRAISQDLSEGLEALVDFDALWARARAARDWDGSVPEVVPSDQRTLRIVDGRHPLLLEQARDEAESGDSADETVVPFHLELGPDEHAVVVSGPNTGGKTVFLKSMGLIHLLAQAGIIPPIGPGTRLPMVRNVLADIGDEQSIDQSLSTFSAHLANAIEILDAAAPDTLILMDELGTGTDPSEGAALARAILETLVERGARTVVTSHLGALKRLDGEGTGIVNASLLFDARRIAPTYELQKGRPGRSYGLAIARRLGVPDEVLQRAEAYVDSGELEVEGLLASLEEKESRLSRLVAEAEEAQERAVRKKQEVEAREGRLRERERTAEARAREKARSLLLEAREEVEEAIREVRSSGTEAAAREEVERKARQRVEEAAREQVGKAPETTARSGSAGAEGVLPGSRVRMVESGTKGRVTAVEDGRVTLEVGALRLQLPLSAVEPLEGTDPRGEGEKDHRGAQPSAGGWTGPDLNVRREADLRGLRVDEVELELGRALDGAVMANLPELRVIHGKGTGAVKARVQELLGTDDRVEDFRPGRRGEGGGGVTVAILR